MLSEILAVVAFAGLFVLFGLLRPRGGCSGDPAGCGRCDDVCTKHSGRGRGREPADPHLEVHR